VAESLRERAKAAKVLGEITRRRRREVGLLAMPKEVISRDPGSLNFTGRLIWVNQFERTESQSEGREIALSLGEGSTGRDVLVFIFAPHGRK